MYECMYVRTTDLLSFQGDVVITCIWGFFTGETWVRTQDFESWSNTFRFLSSSNWILTLKKPLRCSRGRQYWTMYCLQWLLPLLLIPRPANLFLLHNHSMFMTLYLASFFLERRPCTICTIVFIAAVILICYSGIGNCLFLLECST